MKRDSRIYVAGHKGLVGSALVRRLIRAGYTNILTTDRNEVDLRVQSKVENFFSSEKPEYVFMAAAKVGGILANSMYKGDFIYENLAIETNVIGSALQNQVKKMIFFGSSCIYPKFAKQPIHEDSLLSDHLEPTNEAYAIAKIAGVKMCEHLSEQYGVDFYSVMPTNLYGPGDNFDPDSSHVIPGLLRKFHEAKIQNLPSVTVWGSGKPLREFMHVDDLSDAAVYLMEAYGRNDVGNLINVGSGQEISIHDLALLIKAVVKYDGELHFDPTKPDGTPRKLMDSTKLNKLGWRPRIELEDGLASVYAWGQANNVFSAKSDLVRPNNSYGHMLHR